MKFEDLQVQFPQLFTVPLCASAAEAEQYADNTAAQLGLGIRTARWLRQGSTRNVRYTDRENRVQLSVSIVPEGLAGKQVSWSFECSAERLDLGLKLDAPRRKKASSFRKDAKELVSGLRSVQSESRGRLIGRVTKWDRAKGRGYLRCAPAIQLPFTVESVAPDERHHIHFKNWYSFQVQSSPKGQKVTNVRRCPQWLVESQVNRICAPQPIRDEVPAIDTSGS
jgi:hypothetical protein